MTVVPRTPLVRVGLALLCLIVAFACGGTSTTPTSSNPASPSPSPAPSPAPAPAPAPGPVAGGSCRIYPTSATVAINTAGITQNAQLTGAFNTGSNQATITVAFTGGGQCSSAVHSYRSTADFVDEVRVIPPAPLVTSTTTTSSGLCGSGTSTVTNTYDGQRRLTQQSGPTGTTTYTAWDASGRPTSGSFSGGTIANVYNDGARTTTQTQTSGGSTTVTTMTYDANGAQTQVVVNSGPSTTTTTFTNTATAQVCK